MIYLIRSSAYETENINKTNFAQFFESPQTVQADHSGAKFFARQKVSENDLNKTEEKNMELSLNSKTAT